MEYDKYGFEKGCSEVVEKNEVGCFQTEDKFTKQYDNYEQFNQRLTALERTISFYTGRLYLMEDMIKETDKLYQYISKGTIPE